MNMLRFRVISEAEVELFERAPHNPPLFNDAFTKEDFSREWWAVRTALKQRLELLGDEWRLSTGSGDFMLSESHGDSRCVYLTFTSTRLWLPEFAVAVAHLLAGLPHDYSIGCLTELNDEELFEHPLVYLVITSTTVLGQINDLAGVGDPTTGILGKFGFPSPVRPNEA